MDRPLPATIDVAVIGLGGLGSATAYWLARRGVPVLGLEQFELGHVRGASHDHSRIIRRSYHTPAYVELAAQAYDAWRAVEADDGSEIVTITGGIDLFPPGAAIDHRSYTSSLDAAGVAFEWIDGAEVRRRWPAFAGGTAITDDVMAIHSAETGIVPAARATATLQRLATGHGAALHPNTRMLELRPVGGEVDVVTDRGTVRCGHVVPGVDLDGRPQLLRLPRLRRHGGGEGGRGRRRQRGRSRHAHVRSRHSDGATPERVHASARRRWVRRTAQHHLPVHAHRRSRLPVRPPARPPADLGGAGRRARLQVRLVVRPYPRRARLRRRARSRAGAVLVHPPVAHRAGLARRMDGVTASSVSGRG
ncbi:MAG: FAD-dependent oxidoreductase [Actinobacteria bacterium]|nr:FAD-dependent oxidoreductase [Actinomycetota bacterium]